MEGGQRRQSVSLGKGRTRKITSKKAGKCKLPKTGYTIQVVAGARPSPRFSDMSAQTCFAPMSTECLDMSSYKAATEVWWRSEDAIPTIYNMPSEKKKSPPKSEEEKVGRQMSVAKLNNLCNTFDKEELCDGLSRASKTQVLLQTKNENENILSNKNMSDQTIWFDRRR